MGRSKSHKKSKSHTERDRFVGSWHKGFGSSAKSKARGSKALGRRLVHGFVDRFVDRQSRRHDLGYGFVAWSGLWVRRCSQRHDLGSLFFLSLSLSLFARKSGNCLKWKFWLKPIFGSKPLKHTVNWKYFPENLFSMRNQTLAFTEKHFRKWFEAKTNTAYIYEREGKWMQWMKLLWNIRFILLFESFNRRNWNVIFMFECEEMKWIKENTHFSIFIFPSKFKILFPPKFWSNWNEWNDILVWW